MRHEGVHYKPTNLAIFSPPVRKSRSRQLGKRGSHFGLSRRRRDEGDQAYSAFGEHFSWI